MLIVKISAEMPMETLEAINKIIDDRLQELNKKRDAQTERLNKTRICIDNLTQKL